MPEHPYYTTRPLLHEPGPIDTRYFVSKTGIQVRRDEVLSLTGAYDDAMPHPRVMAIMHIYVVPHAAGRGSVPHAARGRARVGQAGTNANRAARRARAAEHARR